MKKTDPKILEEIIRVDHAGEYGATRIYDGQIAVFGKNSNNIELIDPLEYISLVHLLNLSHIVLTDSGGIQEETTFFGVSCITVRENTERPITISNGTNKLIGEEYDKIPQEIEATIKDKRIEDIV